MAEGIKESGAKCNANALFPAHKKHIHNPQPALLMTTTTSSICVRGAERKEENNIADARQIPKCMHQGGFFREP
jgi:hypothetical protein